MEGRRVEERRRKRNPLFTIFVVLVTVTLAMLVLTIIMGAKLKTANRKLAIAEMKIAQYEQQKEEQPKRKDPDIGSIPHSMIDAKEPEPELEPESEPEPKDNEQKIGWLDLAGHNEVQVKPTSVFDDYHTRYAAEDINLRGGPGTSYDRIRLIECGAQVKAAAEEGEWSFVNVGDKFGWMKSEYLSDTKPGERTVPAEQESAGQEPVKETVASLGQLDF